MSATAIIVAAGNSARMGFDKIFAEICGKPVLLYSLEAFQNSKSIDKIIVVTHPEHSVRIREFDIPKLTDVVQGGSDRVQSVLNGINVITHNNGSNDIVAIHDGARPLITPSLIDEVVGEAKTHKAAILAVPVKDTIKSEKRGFVHSTLDRSCLYAAQTPQVFDLRLYLDVIETSKIATGGFSVTDDSTLFERMGISVKLIEGSYSNIKITTPQDLLIAKDLINGIN